MNVPGLNTVREPKHHTPVVNPTANTTKYRYELSGEIMPTITTALPDAFERFACHIAVDYTKHHIFFKSAEGRASRYKKFSLVQTPKFRYDGYMRWFAMVVVAGFLMFTVSVYASEGIISPIPDPTPIIAPLINKKPLISFSDLLNAMPEAGGNVLGATATATLSATLTPPPQVTPEANPTPSPATRTAKKRAMTITLLGDSMIDTLGPIGGGLASRLNAVYPNATFTIINHGVGAENIDSGLRRLTNGYSYLGLGRNSVISEKPDIIVIESFGYNPYPLPDINDALTTHWLRMASLVDTIHQQSPETKIVMAATIAPNWDVFGDGAPFINFSPEGKRMKVEEIKKYIENTIAFAKSQGLPLADAYHPSLDAAGNGKLTYINAGDHIHYSDAGRALFSQIIANTLVSNRLLE